MLGLMRDPTVSTDVRIDMAVAAAPFVHRRPKRVSRRRFDPAEPRTFSDTSFRRVERKLITMPLGVAGGPDLTPLDFLMSVLNDPGATPRQRIRAARVAASYQHTAAQPDEVEIDDQFGFKVDPAVARMIRDDNKRLQHLWAMGVGAPRGSEQERAALKARVAEQSSVLECPPGYTQSDLRKDVIRLDEFDRKRASRTRLTEEEDAEEAHLGARVRAYWAPSNRSPEKVARDRISEIQSQCIKIFREGLSAAEQSELDNLRARYPDPPTDPNDDLMDDPVLNGLRRMIEGFRGAAAVDQSSSGPGRK